MASEAEASPSEVVEQSAELQIMDNVEAPAESLDWSSLLKNLKTSELQRKKRRLAAAESMISQHNPAGNVASEDIFSDSLQGSVQHPVVDPLLEAAHCGSHGRTIETRHATFNSTQWLWAALFSILISTLLVGLGVASLAVYWEEHEGLHFWQTTSISGHDQRAGCKVLSKGVDLRTAKLCGLDTFQPLHPVSQAGAAHRHMKGELCRFVYYWVAVFQVELWPRSASLPTRAFAEKPDALLFESCRPGFTEVWNLKEGFRINGTYACTFNQARTQQVSLEGRNFSSCPECPGVQKASQRATHYPFSLKLVEKIRSACRTIWGEFDPGLRISHEIFGSGLWWAFIVLASLRLTRKLMKKQTTTPDTDRGHSSRAACLQTVP